MSKITNPWLTPLQRSFNRIKYTLLEKVKSLKDADGNQLITDYSEGNIFVIIISLFSAIAEVLHYYIDNVARESFFVTARRYSSLIKHASMLDYHPRSATAARVDVVLTRTLNDVSVSQSITIPQGLVFTDNSGNQWVSEREVIWYSNTTTCRIPLIQETIEYTTSLNGNFIPTTEGNIVLELPSSSKVYKQGSLEISLDGTSWSLVDTLAYSKHDDLHYTTRVTEDGTVKIIFGDGVFGYKPLSDSIVTKCTYKSTLGSKGNIPANNITKTPAFITGRVPSVTCNNPLPASGGSDYEDFNKLKTNVPLSIKTLGVAITKEDYANLAMLVPGVSKAAVEYECGRNVNIYISPIGGGVATTELINSVKDYISNHTPLATRLVVKPMGIVDIKLDLTVTGKKSCSSSTISKAIYSALLDRYSPDSVGVFSSVRISEIYALIDNLPVVDHLFINKFYTKPWPTTIYGNTQLVIDSFDILESSGRDNMEYIVVFHTHDTYSILSKYNGYSSGPNFTVGTTHKVEDNMNGFIFTISIAENQYNRGFKYRFTVAKPNYDYVEYDYNLPVFTDPATQLTLTINEVL